MGDGFIVRKGGGGGDAEVLAFGPGPQELVAGDLNSAGFFGLCTQEDFFGNTTDNMATPIMSSLGISQGTAQFTTDPLLKFIHKGKIKYINQRTIRHSTSWDHIQARLSADNSANSVISGNVFKGAILTINGRKYRVRLMRGWGQVSANTNGTGAPDYENGPLMTVSFDFGSDGDNGTNWPTNTSPWNAASPNEWTTLILPIHIDGYYNVNASTSYPDFGPGQKQTTGTPNWASYSDIDLQIASGNGKGTWVQETQNTNTYLGLLRGYSDLAHVRNDHSFNDLFTNGFRLVFELI